MGGAMRKIRKTAQQVQLPVTISRTHFMWNGIEICLLIPNQLDAVRVTGDFRQFMDWATQRAFTPNTRDMYAAHLQILEKVKNGEDLVDKGSNDTNAKADN